MSPNIQILIIDDDQTNINQIRAGVVSYFKVTVIPNVSFSDEGYSTYIYNDGVTLLQLTEMLEPTIERLDKLFFEKLKSIDIIIFDLLWNHSDMDIFYRPDLGYSDLDFASLLAKIRSLYETNYENLPGGLRFLYKWTSVWRGKFALQPTIIAKSVHFKDATILTLRSLGVDHFLSSDELSKPEKVAVILKSAFETKQWRKAKRENSNLDHYDELINKAPKSQDLLKIILVVAKTDGDILLSGESGTGKKFLARFIHQKSLRSDKTFEVLDFGAIAEDRIEIELFGLEKGVSSKNSPKKLGYFERADGGVLFIDGIEDLSHVTQARLKRVIAEKKVKRVGGNNDIQVNVRLIVSAELKGNESEKEGKLRSDIYYRIISKIEVPPLRDRREDIIPLAEFFIEKSKAKTKIRILEDARQALIAYDWPGNIRELENLILDICERFNEDISLFLLPGNIKKRYQEVQDRRALERKKLLRLKESTKGDIGKMARDYGVSLESMQQLLRDHGI